jgi:hypothetical protein
MSENSSTGAAAAVIAANQNNNRTTVTYLGQSANIGMSFRFTDYAFNPGSNDKGVSDFRMPERGVSAGPSSTIVFPLPKQIVDNLSVNVGGKELGTSGAILGSLAREADGGKQVGQRVINTLTNAKDALEKTGGALYGGEGAANTIQAALSGANFLSRSALSSILPTIGQGIEASLGEAVNPHQTLTFDGVTLKQHTFTWDFAPTDDKESKYIATALHRMKGFSLPRYKSLTGNQVGGDDAFVGDVMTRGLLKYPKLCYVEFISGGMDDAFFFRMKPCMVSNISIDYTPQGNALLRGGRPAFITVSMTLVEQMIHTASDYDTLPAGLGEL